MLSAKLLLQQQHHAVLPALLLNLDSQHCSSLQATTTSSSSSWALWHPQHAAHPVRQYAGDGSPDPMIVPLQRQVKQQTAPAPLQEHAVELPDSNRGPWERVVDKDSGQPYWWNAKTGTSERHGTTVSKSLSSSVLCV
jgi:hypothetical protein